MIAAARFVQGHYPLLMSYDKKLDTDTISWPGLDYGTHSTENANYVTLERSRLSETKRTKEYSIRNCSCAGRSKAVLVESQMGSQQHPTAAHAH